MLSKFNKQVLKFGAAACLPANLSDEWLIELGEEMAFLQCDVEPGENIRPPSCALAAIFAILIHKNGGSEASIKDDELFELLQEYSIEVELEKMSRWSDITCDSATLDTIFTERNVQFRRNIVDVPHPEKP